MLCYGIIYCTVMYYTIIYYSINAINIYIYIYTYTHIHSYMHASVCYECYDNMPHRTEDDAILIMYISLYV